MDYRIAIPSHNRPNDQITFEYLLSQGFSPLDIDVFVSSSEQAELYRACNPKMDNIIIGKLGMKEIRNFITDYYPTDVKYVSFDDDIKEVRMKNPKEWEESSFADPDELDLDEEIKLAFSECEKSGRRMFGVYPVENHYFMKNQITYDYKFACGGLFGVINEKSLKIKLDQYEDYDRCIQEYLSYGGIVRLNYLCLKTPKMGKNEGGMSDERDFVGDLIKLQDLYPFLVNTKIKKGTGLLNPVLKDTRPHPTMSGPGL
tara:strand:- start:1616 stop:2389 length:774 start_codon:yes stop_codon:yes gene_type:complete